MNLNIVQINLQKSKLSLENFYSYLVQNPLTLGLVQEPYSYGGIIPKHRDFNIFGTQSGRAVIIAPIHLPIFACNELTSKDYTVVILKNGNMSQFLASIYLDINLNPIGPELVKMCNFFNSNNSNAILALDSNSHSPMWGSDINRRGMLLEDFIIETDLTVLNKGKSPTFVSSRGESIIDITLVHGNSDHISSWHVMPNNCFLSDHRGIKFNLTTDKIVPPSVQRTDWTLFKESLQIRDCSYMLWSAETIETEAVLLEKVINNALTQSSFSTPIRARHAKWWTPELHALRKEVIEMNFLMSHSSDAEAKAKFLAAKKHFKKECNLAKRKKWKEFSSSITTPKNMAYFNKILNRKQNQCEHIGMLKDPAGGYAANPQESINLLMKVHFPGCAPLLPGSNNSTARATNVSPINWQSSFRHTVQSAPFIDSCPNKISTKFCSKDDLKHSFINERSVYLAIKSFGPEKKGGPDNYKPKVLQYFVENKVALKRLTKLYQAMIQLGYTPKHWCSAQVIFLQKPNKKDYSEVKSFRPISLMTFLLKSVEKLVLWEIERTALKDKPLSKQQHAFRKGYSCQTAISDLVDSIESNILRDEFSLSVFLDISGAFDNVLYSSIITAMVHRGIEPKIVKWYSQYLKERTAFTELNGVKCSINVQRGCPQGGIISPVIWNLVFESFIELYTKGPVKVRCFADDACLTIGGIDCSTMVDIMQPQLDIASNWGSKEGLIFVPSKTSAIFFHRKKTLPKLKQLKMNGHPIAYQSEVKYLGVHLDSKLTGSYHINQKINKAKRAIMMVKKAIGKIWGPCPKALKWAYDGIIIPALSYGATVWSRICQNGGIKTKLSSLNRLMMLCMMPVRKSTPTAGMEVILHFPPLDIVLKEKALNEMLRVLPLNPHPRWPGEGKKGIGHLKWGRSLLQDLGINKFNFDSTKTILIHKDFKVDLASFKSGLPTTTSEITCFTDGSKLKQHAGYGFGIFKHMSVLTEENGYLGKEASVFQGEILGIHRACSQLLNCNAKSVTIFSDSQAALAALANWKVTSKAVEKCIKNLNLLSQETEVDLKWVRAHSDISGNEFADTMAKLGTQNFKNKVDVSPPISWAKQLIKQSSYKEWSQRWYSTKHYRQSKIWFPSLNRKFSRSLMNLNRSELGLSIQILSGHNRLNYQESKIDTSVNSSCRFCEEEDETAYHIVAECPRLLHKRWECFKEPFLEEEPVWHPAPFLKFLRKAKIGEMNKRESSADSQN